jgi:deoxyribodipyrimidine photolyase-related protein
MTTLRLILGDQLNLQHSWFEKTDDDVVYLMMEMRQETDYVKHHIQKILGFFAAMRNFADRIQEDGHKLIYLRLDYPDNQQDLEKNIRWALEEKEIDHFEYQEPDEYRLDRQLKEIGKKGDAEFVMVSSEHFLTEREDLGNFFEGKKQFLMESFYRSMRKKHDVLMNGDEPVGGQWNFDSDNRKPWDPEQKIPVWVELENDLSEIRKMIDRAGVEYFGEVDEEDFKWPVSRAQACQILDHFATEQVCHFGDFQDAMTEQDDFLFHSRLSFALNSKMLSPKEVIDRVIREWGDREDEISLSQVEGFVRQILGWREFMRGIYWNFMPGYADKNFFEHSASLPKFFWTGETKMNCMNQSIGASLKNAYAHHIQRLMVTGNFALLAGIDPDEVDKWYLGIYIDAIEWVEITNTRGMSQFADGGIVGTKPYVSSANYINKMSDYCSNCHYSHSKKTGDGACPFNSLYWNFYDRHREKLEKNPRIGMMYRNWDRMGSDKKEEYLKQADYYLKNINEL